MVAKSTHTFVNSRYGEKLKVIAEALARIAAITGSDADLRDSEDAKTALLEHHEYQRRVDLQPGTEAQKKGDT